MSDAQEDMFAQTDADDEMIVLDDHLEPDSDPYAADYPAGPSPERVRRSSAIVPPPLPQTAPSTPPPSGPEWSHLPSPPRGESEDVGRHPVTSRRVDAYHSVGLDNRSAVEEPFAGHGRGGSSESHARSRRDVRPGNVQPAADCRGYSADLPQIRHNISPRRFDALGPPPLPTPRGSASPEEIGVGDVLCGKYRVEGWLRRRRLTCSVRVRHPELGESMMLSHLPPWAASRPDIVAGFVRGARAALQIQCEHVARVTDVGRLSNGTPYVVTEHLDGTALDDVLRVRGPLPVAEAIDYIAQTVRAVAEAHARGVVHGALSPAGLVLVRRADGSPLIKVLDFGAGLSLDDLLRSNAAGPGLEVRSTCEVLRYAAPEQIRNVDNPDVRTDVWSLGAILCELLVGRPAFHAPTPAALVAAIAADRVVPPGALRSDVPPELDVVVATCLEKDPTSRYPTLSDLAQALRPHAPPETQDTIDRVIRILARSGGPTSSPAPLVLVTPRPQPPPGAAAAVPAPPRPTQHAPPPLRPGQGLLLPLAVVSVCAGAGAAAVAVAVALSIQPGSSGLHTSANAAIPEVAVPPRAASAPAIGHEVMPSPSASADAPSNRPALPAKAPPSAEPNTANASRAALALSALPDEVGSSAQREQAARWWAEYDAARETRARETAKAEREVAAVPEREAPDQKHPSDALPAAPQGRGIDLFASPK